MPKASEIARSRTTAVDSMKWLAAIVGFLGAMVCAFAAVIFAPVRPDFVPLLGVGLAAVVLPAAIALFTMRGSSAEFKTAWLAALMVALLAWVAGGGWLKRSQGTALVLRESDAAAVVAERRMAALDAGRGIDLPAPPEAQDTANPFLLSSHRFQRHHWRRVENYRRYHAAQAAAGWARLIDPELLRDPKQRAVAQVRFDAGNRALDDWYALETENLRTLRADLAGLSLPEALAAQLERRVASMEYTNKVLAYSEELVLQRTLGVAKALDEHRWVREDDDLRFFTDDGTYAYAEARDLLDRAVANRKVVLMQLHGGYRAEAYAP